MLQMENSSQLNPSQLNAVQHLEGPLLVLAGAGSGKTRVVTCRIAQLIESGVSPSQILAVTFTNKAAGEMRERIHALLPRYDYPTISTFHSLGVKIMRESIQHLGYAPNFLIYDEEDSNKLLRSCLQSVGIKKEVKTFRTLISQAKNALQAPSDLDLSDLPHSMQRIFPEVYSLYQQRLREANALDFDDLLFLTVKLFQDHPDVLAYYQEQWPYLLIDEYQDTNQAQYLMARLIVGQKQNIFVVGDPDQSIYSWRGANIQNILNFEKDYPGARVIRLEQNYRSTTNILDAANTLIQYNNSRYEKNLWSDQGAGEKISLYVGDTEREEAGFVVHEIERLHTFHQIPLSEMTIFYRTNFQSRLFEDFLLRKRLPYVIVGGISFYHRKEIKDLLAFLRMLVSDHDVVSFERTLNLPKRGIGTATLEKIRTQAAQLEVPLLAFCVKLVRGEQEGVRLSAKQREGLSAYTRLIQNLRELIASSSLQKLVIETIRQSNYLDILREDKETFEDRKGNVDELVAKAHEWEVMNDSTELEGFLEELSLKGSIDEANFSGDQVNLMTIHNGKGLEFRATFLVGMEEDLFPHANSRNSFEALEEERRLCYVGMTRAKERLYLSAAETRFLWGQHRMMRPSRFLREIPKKYLEKFY
ncbi:MAG: ATP-dependent DNA helicase PcrA [Chlamydiales bacterium]|nr:ATP-dependent DNA helicase PcrA [Chlamydiales bacterium]